MVNFRFTKNRHTCTVKSQEIPTHRRETRDKSRTRIKTSIEVIKSVKHHITPNQGSLARHDYEIHNKETEIKHKNLKNWPWDQVEFSPRVHLFRIQQKIHKLE